MGVYKYLRDYCRAWIARIHLPESLRMYGIDGIGVFHVGQQLMAFNRSRHTRASTWYCLRHVSISSYHYLQQK